MGNSPQFDAPLIADGDPAQVITSAWSDQALWSAVATKIGDSCAGGGWSLRRPGWVACFSASWPAR